MRGTTPAMGGWRSTAVLALAILLHAAAAPAAAQVSPQDLQRVQSGQMSPDEIRARIRASGMTDAQIRARLQAAGYSGSLLDAYLGDGAAAQDTTIGPSTAALAAIRSLGIDTIRAEGLLLPDSLLEPEDADTLDVGLRLFGADVFRRPTTEFTPNLSGPVPPSYRLGPGDVMVLVITGDVEFVHSLEVTRDGFVVIPQVGQVFVNNLTMAELNAVLRGRLGRVYSGIRRENATTRFDVTLSRVRTNQVFVIGEVDQPGAYQLSSVATVLNALYAAGGPTERGNFRRIEVRRLGRTVAEFDLYDYLLRGEAGHDIALEQGDVVFVPVHGVRATIAGAVIRPAIYELRPGETIADLVDAAGGFRPDAALERVSISRIVPPGQRRPGDPTRIVLDVPIDAGQPYRAAPLAVEPGDSITVFEVAEARRAFVELHGNVYQPGTYGWSPGLRVSELIRRAGGLRPATYAGRAHIERLNPADSTRFIVEFRLPRDADDAFPEDVALAEYDVVTIYGRDEFREDRTVTIAGMVNRPGTYPFRSGMTLRDLVIMARGLRDGAFLDTAEIARLPENRSRGQLANRIRVPMDSTYLLEHEGTTYPFLPGMPALGRGAPEQPLEPFDHVLVLRQPEFELQRMVRITGEVAFPGTYALTRKDERISDLIQRAGGLLPTAYPDGAEFFRSVGDAGRVDVQVSAIIRDPSSAANLILQPGDSLEVPEYRPVVRVVGAVNAPMSVLYRRGAGLDYYIGNAGGFKREADRKNVSVRYANGSAEVRRRRALLFTSSPRPEPGSTVFVPTLDPEDRINYTRLITDIAQITASVGTVLAIILTRR